MNHLEQKVHNFLKAKNLLPDEETVTITVIKGDTTLEVDKLRGIYYHVQTGEVEDKKLNPGEAYRFLFLPLPSVGDQDISRYLDQHFIQGIGDTSFATEAQYDFNGNLKLVYAAVYQGKAGYGKILYPEGHTDHYLNQQTGELFPEAECSIKINGNILQEEIELFFSNKEGDQQRSIPRKSLPLEQHLEKLLTEFA